MIVKVCGITNVEDALEAAAAGAGALGFNFYPPSPRYITPADARGIIEALPPRVLSVGVFVNEPAAWLYEVRDRAGLDVVQLHGSEKPGDMPPGLRAWKAFRVEPGFDLRALDAYDVEAFLLDGPAGAAYGGSGAPFDWAVAASAPERRIVLAGGLDASNVGAAIRAARPYGVDACSKLESAPGRKDARKVREFIEAALAAAPEAAKSPS